VRESLYSEVKAATGFPAHFSLVAALSDGRLTETQRQTSRPLSVFQVIFRVRICFLLALAVAKNRLELHCQADQHIQHQPIYVSSSAFTPPE